MRPAGYSSMIVSGELKRTSVALIISGITGRFSSSYFSSFRVS